MTKVATKSVTAVNTVNVIEYNNDTIFAVHSFTDNPNGNKEAEILFKQIAVEQELDGVGTRRFSDDEIEGGLDDGILETGDGWQLFITHSEKNNGN